MKFSKKNNQEPIIISSDDGKEHVAQFTKANVRTFLAADEARVNAAKAEKEVDLAERREHVDTCILCAFDDKEVVAGLLDELEPAVISEVFAHIAARCVGMTPEQLAQGMVLVSDEDAEKNDGQSSGDASDSQTAANSHLME